jgi:beta-1,2-mannosidase
MNRLWKRLLVTAAFWSAVVSGDQSGSWQIGPFVRPDGSHPVIAPNRDSLFRNPVDGQPVHWEALHTFNPAAVVRNGRIYVLYRAEDDTGEMRIGLHTSRLGLAESDDGIHFIRRPDPVLYPDRDSQQEREWSGGCEDPRLVESEDGTYVLTYTQWNRQRTDAAIATSKDLVHWTKHGAALGTAGKYGALSYKSAGIVTHVEGGRLLAARIGGKYWMYWGEGVIRLATSDDLIHWKPVEDARGEPVVVLAKRAGRFDSSFPEAGPPPVETAKGIVVLYNGKNAPKGGDPSLGPNAYAAGEALFAADDPAKLIARTDQPVFQPELPFEKVGQYAAGTTFTEGLVWFRSRWFLYYGCADSMVGVAIANAQPWHLAQTRYIP